VTIHGTNFTAGVRVEIRRKSLGPSSLPIAVIQPQELQHDPMNPLGAISFAVAATVLSSAFEWPDILREPADVVLPEFTDGGTSLVWIWFATAWTYAILLVPMLLLPAALGQREDPVLRAATFVGAVSVLLSLIGFLRWVFVVPPLARDYDTVWGSMVKQTIRRVYPGFNEDYYGYPSFDALLEDARDQGLIDLDYDEQRGNFIVRPRAAA